MITKPELIASYKKILEVIDQHKKIEKIKLFFDVPAISPNIHSYLYKIIITKLLLNQNNILRLSFNT